MTSWPKNQTLSVVPEEIANDDDVIEGEPMFADVVDGELFTGEVVSSHDSYCYIRNVRRGYSTQNTNGDVFCPEPIPAGSFVEFTELNTDPKRPNKFRTEHVVVLPAPTGALATTVSQQKALVVQKMTERRSSYHATAKQIDPKAVAQAAENRPFEESILSEAAAPSEPEDINKTAEQFLEGTFNALGSMGVSFKLSDDKRNASDEKKSVDRVVKTLQEGGHGAQATSILRQYRNCIGMREIFGMMSASGTLSRQSVLSIRQLPDFLVTAPVWYQNVNNASSLQYFCNEGKSREFAWFYQLYNARFRSLGDFGGRDIMPLPLVNIMLKAQAHFDITVIATPYHDMVTADWKSGIWPRNIDPFLLGFFTDQPFIFLLGRFSATGLFPLVCDMVADTIDHLRQNNQFLVNIQKNRSWLKGNAGHSNNLLESEREGNNTVLVPFAKQVITAFDAGNLFEFLRGQVPDTAIAKAS